MCVRFTMRKRNVTNGQTGRRHFDLSGPEREIINGCRLGMGVRCWNWMYSVGRGCDWVYTVGAGCAGLRLCVHSWG